MSKDYWMGVFETARRRLEELRERRDTLDAEREEVNLEIVQLEQVVNNLTPLIAEVSADTLPLFLLKNPNEISLADACREVLKNYNRHMTPIEIRNTLELVGYNLRQHSNALASIHGVLKRMAESGEVEQLTHDVLGTMYRWKKPAATGTPLPAHGAGGGTVKRGNSGDPPPIPNFWSTDVTRETPLETLKREKK